MKQKFHSCSKQYVVPWLEKADGSYILSVISFEQILPIVINRGL